MKAIKTIIGEVLIDSLEQTNLTKEQKKTIDFQDRIKDVIEKALKMQRVEILKEISEDIKRQKCGLEDDFEKDKPFKWRIEGMKYLESIIVSGEDVPNLGEKLK